jgi:hypothetical protein
MELARCVDVRMTIIDCECGNHNQYEFIKCATGNFACLCCGRIYNPEGK